MTGRLLQAGHTSWPFALYAASYALGVLCWLRVDVAEPLVADEAPADL